MSATVSPTAFYQMYDGRLVFLCTFGGTLIQINNY